MIGVCSGGVTHMYGGRYVRRTVVLPTVVAAVKVCDELAVVKVVTATGLRFAPRLR